MPATILVLVGVVFGGIFLAAEDYDLIGMLWPLFLIIAGVLLLVLPRARRASQ